MTISDQFKGDRYLRKFWERLFGLSPMGQIGDSYKGWVFIPNCRSIHTFTLRHPIDIEWVDAEGKLLRRERSVPPRSIRHCANAYGVRERYSPRALMKQEGWGATEAIVAIPIALMFFFIAMQVAYIAIGKVHLGHTLREGLRAAASELTVPSSVVSAQRSGGDNPASRLSGPFQAVSRQSAAESAFEDAINKTLKPWAAFYGESQKPDQNLQYQSKGELAVNNSKQGPTWSSSLHLGQLELGQALYSDSSIPDHLVGVLSYWMPIKMPFFGKAVSLVISSSNDCSNEFGKATLCFMSGRWYWRLMSQARIPLPPWEASGTHSAAQEGSESAISDSKPITMPNEHVFEAQVNQGSAAAIPGLVYVATDTRAAVPQTIAALRNEIAATGDPSYESRHQVEPDCGIQFGL
ncbi:MAG: hypothetical protein RL585_2024 [Pseudomonadota bacterium]